MHPSHNLIRQRQRQREAQHYHEEQTQSQTQSQPLEHETKTVEFRRKLLTGVLSQMSRADQAQYAANVSRQSSKRNLEDLDDISGKRHKPDSALADTDPRQKVVDQLYDRVTLAQRQGRIHPAMSSSSVALFLEKSLIKVPTGSASLGVGIGNGTDASSDSVSDLDQRLAALAARLKHRRQSNHKNKTMVNLVLSHYHQQQQNNGQMNASSPTTTMPAREDHDAVKPLEQPPNVSAPSTDSTSPPYSSSYVCQLSHHETARAQRRHRMHKIRQLAQLYKCSWARQCDANCPGCGVDSAFFHTKSSKDLPEPVRRFFFQTKLLRSHFATGYLENLQQEEEWLAEAEQNLHDYRAWAAGVKDQKQKCADSGTATGIPPSTTRNMTKFDSVTTSPTEFYCPTATTDTTFATNDANNNAINTMATLTTNDNGTLSGSVFQNDNIQDDNDVHRDRHHPHFVDEQDLCAVEAAIATLDDHHHDQIHDDNNMNNNTMSTVNQQQPDFGNDTFPRLQFDPNTTLDELAAV